MLDEGVKESPNSMWRATDLYKRETVFADLALRLVSCVVSEADAERHFLIQKTLQAFTEPNW
jgi:hypothetical protein